MLKLRSSEARRIARTGSLHDDLRVSGPFRIAFLGAGMVAELHQRAIARIDGAELVGVYEPLAELARTRARDWGCRAYASESELLADPEVDGVFVLTPFDTHERLATDALNAHKHVLVEKPVAGPAGIERLLSLAEGVGRLCLPGHNYAYQPEFQQLRSLVRDGSLGEVRAAWVTYAIRHPEEIAARYAGVMEEVMVHHAYLALSLFGKPSHVVAGAPESRWHGLEQDDQAWMTWTYPHGLTAHLFASFAVDDETADPWTFVVKILGTRGGGTYSWRSVSYDRPLGTLSRAFPAYEDSYVHQDTAFIASATGARDAVVSPLSDALVVADVLALARESANAGARAPVTRPR